MGYNRWWEEYQYHGIDKFRKDDTLSNVKGYFSIETFDDLKYIPADRDKQKSLADIIVEHYRKSLGLHVECRQIDVGSRRHSYIETHLDCHVINAPKWLKQNEDGTYTITNVKSYLTACNTMVENVCSECARNHLNAGKLFHPIESSECIEYGIAVALPFGIDCDRMIQQREAEWKAHKERQDKCNALCDERINNIINNPKDIYDVAKSYLTTAEVKDVVFYWDSYSRHDGYQIIIQMDDVYVNINALKCSKYCSKRYWYELSDKITVIYKYEDCTSYRAAYNVLRSLALADDKVLRYVKEKMNITGYEVEYPEKVSRYVDHNWW